MEERRQIVRRRADRELHELIEAKTGLKPSQLVRNRKLRRAIRHTCKAVIEMEVAHSAGESQIWQKDQHEMKARVLDLSEGGAALFTRHEIRPGQPVNVDIKLYDGTSIEAESEVRWTKPKQEKKGFALGVQFKKLDERNRKRLSRFLNELDASLGMQPGEEQLV